MRHLDSILALTTPWISRPREAAAESQLRVAQATYAKVFLTFHFFFFARWGFYEQRRENVRLVSRRGVISVYWFRGELRFIGFGGAMRLEAMAGRLGGAAAA